MSNPGKTKYRCRRVDEKTNRVIFDDGEEFLSPPPTKEARRRLLERVAAAKKPECKTCQDLQHPIIIGNGGIKFVCANCNATAVLTTKYRKLSDVELIERCRDAHETYTRCILVINNVQRERRERENAKR